MFTSRLLLLALGLLGYIVLFPSVSNANPEFLTDRGCRGCHTPPVTCTGCHAHGTHNTLAKDMMNLSAIVDKASYVVGDDISVTLTSGYKPTGWSSGWVRVSVYASNGTLLVSNKTDCPHNAASYTNCDLPVILKARAQSGMTNLYVAWMGNENDKANPVTGLDIPTTSVIGVGKRAASGVPTGHIEEIVLTNSFTVTDAPKASSGGGAFDWALLAGLISLCFVRRKTLR